MGLFNVGDVFIGENGNRFTIIEHRPARPCAGIVDDYILSDKKGLHTHAPDALLNWMLKSGGMTRKEMEVAE